MTRPVYFTPLYRNFSCVAEGTPRLSLAAAARVRCSLPRPSPAIAHGDEVQRRRRPQRILLLRIRCPWSRLPHARRSLCRAVWRTTQHLMPPTGSVACIGQQRIRCIVPCTRHTCSIPQPPPYQAFSPCVRRTQRHTCAHTPHLQAGAARSSQCHPHTCLADVTP